ncbi:MAG: DUF6194 family protein [Lapillicoccus sp.]
MTEDDVIGFARGLDGVTVETTSAESGAPEAAWGDSFVYYDVPGAEPEPPERRWPFATLVVHDYAGFDEASRLDRDGVFRVNVNVGKRRFEVLVGYPPSRHVQRRGETDYATLDRILPHPEYGQRGWVCVLNPGERTADLVRSLLREARERTASRHTPGH